MVDQTQYFDLYQVLVNELVGDVWLSILLAFVLIMFLTIKLKMSMQLAVVFGLLFLSIMFAEVQGGFLIIWVFVVLFVGVLFYFTVSKAMG